MITDTPLSILYVDDDAEDFLMIRGLLDAAAEVDHAGTSAAALEKVQARSYDLLLLDYRLGRDNGLELMRQLRASGVKTPVIFLTGQGDEEVAVQAMKGGATDYLLKSRLTESVLSRAVQYAVKLHSESKRMEQMQEALRHSQERLQALVENIADTILVLDEQGIVSFATSRFPLEVPASGKSPRSVFALIHPKDRARVRQVWQECITRPRAVATAEFRVRAGQQGDWRTVEASAANRLDHPAVAGVIVSYHDVTERRRNEQRLHESQEKYRHMVDNATYGIFRTAPDGTILDANPALVSMLSYSSIEDLRGKNLTSFWDNPAGTSVLLESARREGPKVPTEVAWKCRSGRMISVRLYGQQVCDRAGAVLYCEVIAEDITQQRHLESQLRQSQKMEAIGHLAGGIAHDFNNLLAVVLGYADLLEGRAELGEKCRQEVNGIKQAATRAAELTHQLLAFSRKQVLEVRELDLGAIVKNISTMLRRLLGEDVDLFTDIGPEPGLVKVDPVQVEQIILNLAVNARDAMPEGGRLTLTVANVEVAEADAMLQYGQAPGNYVVLTVSDNGCGMDEETQRHIFEPFFTTKDKARGTGLGLSTVYGIVKQSGGFIFAHSQPGEGTTFQIYLPQVAASKGTAAASRAAAAPEHGSETVLLVEDDAMLRELNSRLLTTLGYRVMAAEDAERALQVAASLDGPIHLLMTDVIMPGMNGRQLAEKLVESRPQTRVLFVSGYADDMLERALVNSVAAFLQKPFSREALAEKIHQVLHPGQAPTAARSPMGPEVGIY